MALETSLARPRSTGKDHTGSLFTLFSPKLVVGRAQHFKGPTFAPSSTHSSTVYRRLKRRLGRSLRGLHCKTCLVSHGKSPSHKFLRAKGSSGPKEFRASLQGPDCACCDRQQNSGLLHQQAGRYEVRLSLCPPLEIISWCHPRGIVLRARHIPGRLNVIADKLSRHNQVIQTEWSLSQEVFILLCSRWAQPQVDLFATRFNHKLPQFVSPVPDPAAWAVDALSLPWENMDVYAFPPVSLINQVISKVMDQGCRRMVLIAPGWPNMPWFWDLVKLSVQIPFSLPMQRDLVTQPFNGMVHRNLNLNLHAWLLESLPSKNKVSLMRWQEELRLLTEAQPEPSTSQSGPFLLNGVSHTRWISGHPL